MAQAGGGRTKVHVFRPVEPGDLALIRRHRMEMFRASGRDEAILAQMDEPFGAWLAPRLASGDYFGWVGMTPSGEAIAGLGMMVIDWPPHPSHPTQSARGYILNVFVEPEHRGRGLARALMDLAMEEARRRGLDHLILHATPMGRPLYQALGWTQTSEMGLSLRVGG
jgi:GNAT superfamily N-acetyltransferase